MPLALYGIQERKTETMKKMISIFTLVAMVVFVSCNTSAIRQQQASLEAQQHTIDSLKMEMVKQQTIDSMNEVMGTRYMIPQIITPLNEQSTRSTAKATTKKRSITKKNTVSNSVNESYSQPVASSQSEPVYTSTSAAESYPVNQDLPAAEPEKKGWSAKAKGAVIGAGTGAVAGAVINKRNRAVGALIGGVLGAGAGTGIGAVIDNKNGR